MFEGSFAFASKFLGHLVSNESLQAIAHLESTALPQAIAQKDAVGQYCGPCSVMGDGRESQGQQMQNYLGIVKAGMTGTYLLVLAYKYCTGPIILSASSILWAVCPGMSGVA